MPWKETCTMDQKVQMIGDYLREEYTITQLSGMYEVSRKTIYKWVGRTREMDLLVLRSSQEHPGDIPMPRRLT